VAANTLLRLEEEAPAARRDIGRQAGLLSMDDGVDNLRRELRGVRHEYFTVRGRADKLRLRAVSNSVYRILRTFCYESVFD